MVEVLPGGTRENLNKHVRIASVLAEIQTRYSQVQAKSVFGMPTRVEIITDAVTFVFWYICSVCPVTDSEKVQKLYIFMPL
jgi:hypothetical protein